MHAHPVRVKNVKAEAGEMAGKHLFLQKTWVWFPAAGWQPIVWAEEVM